jgi:transposase
MAKMHFWGKGNLKPTDEELRRLKRENEELREENEILKKAAAIFAKHQK